MPATRAALAAGDISAAHAHRLARLCAPEVADAFTEAEETLVSHARRLRWADFARVATYWDHCARPARTEADAADDRAARRAHLSPGLRGTGHLDAELDPIGYAPTGPPPRPNTGTPPPTPIWPGPRPSGARMP